VVRSWGGVPPPFISEKGALFFSASLAVPFFIFGEGFSFPCGGVSPPFLSLRCLIFTACNDPPPMQGPRPAPLYLFELIMDRFFTPPWKRPPPPSPPFHSESPRPNCRKRTFLLFLLKTNPVLFLAEIPVYWGFIRNSDNNPVFDFFSLDHCFPSSPVTSLSICAAQFFSATLPPSCPADRSPKIFRTFNPAFIDQDYTSLPHASPLWQPSFLPPR